MISRDGKDSTVCFKKKHKTLESNRLGLQSQILCNCKFITLSKSHFPYLLNTIARQ